MKASVMLLAFCLALQPARAQLIANSQRVTLPGKWVTIDQNSLAKTVTDAYAAAGVAVPEGSCEFSITIKAGDKKPIRYVQASQVRQNTDGSCEMDFDVGDPVATTSTSGAVTAPKPDNNIAPNFMVQPMDSGGGNGIHTGSGGVTAGYADPVGLAVTELWVGQNFTWNYMCVWLTNAWSGSYQRDATGWVNLGYQFNSGVYICPSCGSGGGAVPTRLHQMACSLTRFFARLCLANQARRSSIITTLPITDPLKELPNTRGALRRQGSALCC